MISSVSCAPLDSRFRPAPRTSSWCAWGTPPGRDGSCGNGGLPFGTAPPSACRSTYEWAYERRRSVSSWWEPWRRRGDDGQGSDGSGHGFFGGEERARRGPLPRLRRRGRGGGGLQGPEHVEQLPRDARRP